MRTRASDDLDYARTSYEKWHRQEASERDKDDTTNKEVCQRVRRSELRQLTRFRPAAMEFDDDTEAAYQAVPEGMRKWISTQF